MLKRTALLIILASIVFSIASAQETVTVRKSDLTADQLKKLETDRITQQLGQYKEWSEMGRGIGIAVKDSLYAVKDVAIDFSKTDVGKFTLFLVAWKIMAKDVLSMGDMVVGYLVGIPLLFTGMIVLIWSYRRQCLPQRILIEDSKEKGKKWGILSPNGEVSNWGSDSAPDMVSDRSAWAVGHAVVGFVWLGVCCAIMFMGN